MRNDLLLEWPELPLKFIINMIILLDMLEIYDCNITNLCYVIMVIFYHFHFPFIRLKDTFM